MIAFLTWSNASEKTNKAVKLRLPTADSYYEVPDEPS